MATTTTTSGGTVTSFSNTPQATGDIFTTGVTDAGAASITEELLGVVYLDVMSNDLGGNAKTLWSLDNATSFSTATKVYAPADLLVQDTCRIESTSTDTSLNGAKIWITSDGKVGYDATTLSCDFRAKLQSLAAGASLTDCFTYAIRLGNGTLSWATAQVQFAGVNDSVTMSLGVQAGTVTEDAITTPSATDSLSATGTIAFSDVDLSDTHTASFVAGGNATALGTFTLAAVTEADTAANGTVSWTYTIDNEAAQSLAQGQTATETYVVTISDGHGSSTTQNVTITITGTNDQVQITSGVQAGDAKEDSGDYAASGNITFTDVDLIDTHSVTVTPGALGYLGSFTTDSLNDSTGTGSGSLGWHFAVDNADLQFLGEGQTVTQTYNVAIGDDVVQTVTITITGTNDRPTLTIADSAGTMNEGNGAATLSDSGALTFADVDNIDVVTVSHTSNGNIAWSGGTLNAGVASALVAGFSVDQDSWNYSSSQNLDFLGAGETITFSYKVIATDNSGAADAASAPQTVTITITGSNDAPVLSFEAGNDVGTVKEDTTLSVSGQFSSADIDHGATATWSIAGSNTGSYGSIAVDSSGKWTYTLANGTDGVASAVQSLAAGESHNEVFSVQVSDGLGGVDTQLVTVTVTGSNDAPVLSFETGNDVGTVKEDTTLSVSGQFSSTDIDHDATATWSIAGTNTGSYGSIAVDSSGQWTYTLANGTDGVASAVQSLKAGESHNEVFSVQVSDGLGGVDTQQVTVTVTGSNDAPVLSFATDNDVGTVKEDTTLSISGQFSSTDIDHDATASWSIAGTDTGNYGSIAVDSSGQWTYTLANGTDGVASAVQSLKAGESHDEVFSVQVSDGLGGVDTQLVTITVTGSNDAPVLSFATDNDVGTVKEDTTLSISGQFSSTDIDHDATATWSIAGSNTGSYGSIAVDSSGKWTYTLANGSDGIASAVQSLKAGESHDEVFSVQVSDGLGGVDTQQVTVTVTGSNDRPTLTITDTTGAMNEGNGTATLSDSGTLSFADVDSTDVVTVSQTANNDIVWSGGTLNAGVASALVAGFSVDQDSWNYSTSQNLDFLDAGETITFSYTVVATDDSGAANAASTIQTVTITLTGTNDGPVAVADVAAGTENQTLTIDVLANDTDVDDGHLFTLNSASAPLGQGTASVVANQLVFAPGSNFDHLAQGAVAHVTLSYTMQDEHGALSSSTVDVTITGTNDGPVAVADTAAGTENQTLTIDVLANDTDVDDGHLFTLNSASAPLGQGTASVVANQLVFNPGSNFDHLAQGAVAHVTLSYTMQDEHGALSSSTVDVTITGTNDQPTLTIADTTGAMNEGNGAATLSDSGALSFADLDSTDVVTVSHTFNGDIAWSGGGTLNAGVASALVAGFSVDQDSWNYSSSQNLDFLGAGETITFSYTVVATDDSGAANAASATKTVTITLTGDNDAPTVTSGTTASVAENALASTVVYTAMATDLDASDGKTWTLTGTDASLLHINSSTGEVTLNTSANYETKSSYSFNVVVTDNGGLSDSKAVTLNITDVNEAPTAVSFSNTTTAINENVVVGAGIKVADIAITDDALGSETLSLSGADAASFAIVGSELRYVGASPNFEVKSSYSVTVNANDATVGGNPDASQNFTLNINDINVAPVFSSGSIGTIAENSAISTVAYDANATDDGENNNTLTYSLSSGGDNDKFNINSSNGEVTFKVSPNYEAPTDVGANNVYDITVHANDGTLDTTKAVAITVTDVSEITGIASIGAPTMSGNKTNVVITFSKAVDISTLSAADFQFTYGPTTITPTIQTSSFTAGNTVWNVQFDSFTGNTSNSGTLTLSGATYSFADTTAGASASYNSFVMYPAGVAGKPINLALTDPALGASGSIGVTITGMPLGWTLNAGTNNGDGTWTVQTNDPSSLTVTTPSDFAGALVLGVSMTWTNADGSIGNAYVADNVEAFTPGNPIFALSTDDNLTGSSGADTFVFAQPIGNNQIYSFDATADKIDLIGFTGVTGFADLSITNDANGNALVSISSGQTVTLKGVDAADLSEANFQFDVDPLTNNAGTLTIADGAIMPFGGSIHNSGTIELGATGNETSLEILFRGATLTGGGQVLLSDSAQNVIFGGTADTVLTNIDNRISGAGQLGAGQLVLVNAGLILASGLNSLVLDTGTHTIVNSGVLESTGAGGMTVASAVENSGHLWANGGDLRLLAGVTGNGSATIDGDATLTFAGAAHGSVAFHGEGAGTLVIAQAEAAGSLVGILGLESDDMLTFGDLAFGANTQLSYSANASGAGGLLTVDDGMHRAEVNLLGHYSVEDFQITDGGEAGTQVSYQGESSGTLVGSMLADTLSGGDGNDIIAGRGGEDTLSGGAGADVFAYLNVDEGGDHILDYSFAEGDTVDLSALLNANFVSGTSQVSDFVQLAQSGNDITVKVDTDGAANGTNFADVAVLANTGTSGTDLVRTWFGEADHTLTA